MAEITIGKVLRDLYLATGRKMEVFSDAVAFDAKTCYYHFKKKDLNTSILEKYEDGLRKLGYHIDVFEVVSRMRRGESIEQAMKPVPVTAMSEPVVVYQRKQDELLREVAEELSRASRKFEQLRELQNDRPVTPPGQTPPEK